MTDAEWERCTDRARMLEFLQDRISERKYRLFAVACCRQQWELFPHIPHRRVIEAAEQFADGQCTIEELRTVAEPLMRLQAKSKLTREQRKLTGAAYSLTLTPVDYNPLWRQTLGAVQSVSEAVAARHGDYTAEFYDSEREMLPQISMLHDIVGNPFYPEAVEPTWLTATVVQLARTMYESRDFSPMPILADALQDADCDNHIILGHCHGSWPHVRGCWVVDLILGKE